MDIFFKKMKQLRWKPQVYLMKPCITSIDSNGWEFMFHDWEIRGARIKQILTLEGSFSAIEYKAICKKSMFSVCIYVYIKDTVIFPQKNALFLYQQWNIYRARISSRSCDGHIDDVNFRKLTKYDWLKINNWRRLKFNISFGSSLELLSYKI